MNKKQWYASGFVFFAFAILLSCISIGYGAYTEVMVGWGWLVGRMYSLLAWLFYALFFVCLACGLFEKEGKKK